MWMQPKALKCLCAQIRCGIRRSGARSCLLHASKERKQLCHWGVSGWLGRICIYIYKHETTTQSDSLPHFIARQQVAGEVNLPCVACRKHVCLCGCLWLDNYGWTWVKFWLLHLCMRWICSAWMTPISVSIKWIESWMQEFVAAFIYICAEWITC